MGETELVRDALDESEFTPAELDRIRRYVAMDPCDNCQRIGGWDLWPRPVPAPTEPLMLLVLAWCFHCRNGAKLLSMDALGRL